MGALHFKNSEQSLELVDFSYHPIKSLEHLASRRTFADNLFAVSIKNLSLLGVNIDAFEENQLGSLRTILVDGMDIHILKNKQKPLNTRIRPLLPHQQLKNLNYPIHIGQIAILNSSLTYKEIQPKDAHDIMTVNLSDLNAEVNYITSIKDSLVSGKTLSIALRAKLMDKAEMDVSIAMPYNHRNDAFHFRGNIGPANLSIFNPLLMPSARIAVKKGKMESIQFSVNATPDHAEGELTMRYSDLHVDIPRRNKNGG